MKIIPPKDLKVHANPILSSSKSESNRALIIQSISNNKINLNNLSFSEDTQILQSAIRNLKSQTTINCNHAGTTFRFLTSYLSTIEGEWVIDGSSRLQQRPISHLVEALIELGANIEYNGRNGFAPIKIKGTEFKKNKVNIYGNVSSQFISALLLIAPSLKDGLKLNIKGPIYSKPYIELTLKMMSDFGIKYKWKDSLIEITNQPYKTNNYTIENDWSAASYWYSMAALSNKSTISIKGLKEKSHQGDAIIKEYFKHFGIDSRFKNNELIIKKTSEPIKRTINLNLNAYPDIAQTIAVTCVGLGLECHLNGLETLQLKETNRLEALRIEFQKLGIQCDLEDNSISIPGNQSLKYQHTVATYNDHRMAMAFTPLSLITGEIEIKNPEVVKKSYPEFWNDLSKAGFVIQ